MKKTAMTIFLAIALCILSMQVCCKNVRADDDAFVNSLDDVAMQQMFIYSVAQAKSMGYIISETIPPDGVQDSGLLEEKICDYLRKMDYASPIRAVFMIPNDNYQNDYYCNGYEFEEKKLALSFRENFAFNTMDVVMSMSGKSTDLKTSLFFDNVSIYDTTYIDGLLGVTYVMLLYAEELPWVITVFCDMDDDVSMTKTQLFYIDPMDDDYNSTQLLRYVDRVWGEDAYDMTVYRCNAGQQ